MRVCVGNCVLPLGGETVAFLHAQSLLDCVGPGPGQAEDQEPSFAWFYVKLSCNSQLEGLPYLGTFGSSAGEK